LRGQNVFNTAKSYRQCLGACPEVVYFARFNLEWLTDGCDSISP